MSMQPELKVQLELDAHEKECAIRYQMVNDKLEGLDKRMWRIEAMSMVGTLGIVALIDIFVVPSKSTLYCACSIFIFTSIILHLLIYFCFPVFV